MEFTNYALGCTVCNLYFENTLKIFCFIFKVIFFLGGIMRHNYISTTFQTYFQADNILRRREFLKEQFFNFVSRVFERACRYRLISTSASWWFCLLLGTINNYNYLPIVQLLSATFQIHFQEDDILYKEFF